MKGKGCCLTAGFMVMLLLGPRLGWEVFENKK